MMLSLTVNVNQGNPNVPSVKVYSKFFVAATTQ